MPEVNRFYGIVIQIFFRDHEPPHFHARCGSHDAVIDIEDGAFNRGDLPVRLGGSCWSGPHCIGTNCWLRGKGRGAGTRLDGSRHWTDRHTDPASGVAVQ